MNPLQTLIKQRSSSSIKGIFSLCTAHPMVIEAALDHLLDSNIPLLIEATANQVNQFGGYTNMTPIDYRNFVVDLANEKSFPLDRLFFGGDHLGPLIWINLPADEAMDRAEELVRQFVMAGFTKIHLDTSMRLSSDDPNVPLSTQVIAERGIRLMKTAEAAFTHYKSSHPEAYPLVYIIGSEVPIPGGAQEEEGISVTKADDFRNTVHVYQDLMNKNGLGDVWSQILGVVVQPGVEFGDDSVHIYDRSAASKLIDSLSAFNGLVFEGHSTDYQTQTSLREMVEDGIAILKVGPALTFALREGLFALSYIEDELVTSDKRSNFRVILDEAMINHPENWKKHYHGSETDLIFKRKYSYSDRSRYYLPDPMVEKAIGVMLENTRSIPASLLSQFMPIQFSKVRSGVLKKDPQSLVMDWVNVLIDDYVYACETKPE